ncbi:TetR/AcrR family transcriptional regulator [Cellulomonas sp. ES6]|uniref:TetR/AcrR family transcriptional regulator n=1 Tax=Cellulomonas sp. ES6 TaxID=3039384 RepID=UPI0024B71E90|nr:TetR/AcrR family transcriptional regulator [Cellulomonas sp. ES6]WHP16146.1 helix-turn-helix domain-containing protein [Cellulomonas sp. ES6]
MTDPRTGLPAAAGRRERKKAETRQALVAAARRLFVERGYDDVTVAQIAEEADTAVTTLFNHFPDGKEALVFDDIAGEDERASSLAAAVRGTGSARAALEALGRFFRGRGVFVPDPSPEEQQVLGLILRTPQLRTYARRQWEACEEALTAALAAEAGAAPDDPALRALARYVLQIPDLATDATEPRAALDAIIARLVSGWGADPA